MTGEQARLQRVRLLLIAVTGLVVVLGVGIALGVAAERVAARPIPLVLGASVLAVAVLLFAVALLTRVARRVPAPTVLEFDLTQPLSDVSATDPLAAVTSRGRPTLQAAVDLLERAAGDDRVAGLFARIGGTAGGFATVQELRDAVLAFRAAGKFAVAHAETFGEFSPGNGAYLLATAFDEIHLQPSGDVGLVGLGAEVNFLRGALDKAGVVGDLDHRHEYKSAKDIFTEAAFTPAHREATGRIVESLFDQLVASVAEGRGLTEAQVRALVDEGPLLGADAVGAGLVDRLSYRDEAVAAAKERAGEGARLLALQEYRRRRRGRDPRRTPTVALITGTGAIAQGRSSVSPLTGRGMGADTIASALRKATADRDVGAILLRVNSPGGSYVASDTIWRETVRAREAGKPLVVSMGDVAASGGYFVAAAADRIVAHPGTITGSIGVVGGKTVVAGLKDKVGVTTDEVHEGASALIASASRAYSEVEWERLQRWLDHAYDDFTGKVAQGRNLPLERVRDIARGRVWTGADALGLGLVDALGGYPEALRLVRECLDLPSGARLRLRSFPPRRSLWSRLVQGSETSEEEAQVALGFDFAGRVGAQGALTMPRLKIRW